MQAGSGRKSSEVHAGERNQRAMFIFSTGDD
jgi:hypothetical protein